jgi:hypothetical protein
MEPLKAVVKNGRLILDAPTELPEGSVVELAIVHDDRDEDPKLIEELTASAEDEAAGYVIDFEAVSAPLGVKQRT